MKPHTVHGVAIFCLIALAMVLGAYAVSSTYEVPAENVARIADAGPNHDNTEIEKEKPFLRILFHDPTAFFTMVLAVFTMGLAGVTVAIWRETKVASAEQAALTREALENARLHADRDLRPWLTIGSVEITGPVQIEDVVDGRGLRINLTLVIRNAGRSAAMCVRTSAEAENLMGLQDRIWYSDQITQETERAVRADLRNGQLLGPGETMTVLHGTMISEPSFNRRIGDLSNFISPVVLVTVTYRDTGSPEVIRYTALPFLILRQHGPTVSMAIDTSLLPIHDAEASIHPGYAFAT